MPIADHGQITRLRCYYESLGPRVTSWSIVQGSELTGVVSQPPAIRYSAGDYHTRPSSIWGYHFSILKPTWGLSIPHNLVPYNHDDMVHIHNAYPIPQFTPSQLETLTAICDTLFQAHTGEEAAAIRARLPSDCPDWQKAKGRSRLRESNGPDQS
jgi:hypothetical protein